MPVEDFTLTLTYLMRVCWSAAAGQLDLVISGEKGDGLSAGVCAKTSQISHKVKLMKVFFFFLFRSGFTSLSLYCLIFDLYQFY